MAPKNNSDSFLGVFALIILLAAAYETYGSTQGFRNWQKLLPSFLLAHKETIVPNSPPAATYDPARVTRVYANHDFHFSFEYPETLMLYHESNRQDLKSFYKKGERVPYLTIFLEENTPLVESDDSGLPNLLPPGLRTTPLFGPFSGPRSQPVGYRLEISAMPKSVLEKIDQRLKETAQKDCQKDSLENKTVSGVIVAGVGGFKIHCSTDIYLFLDPLHKAQYFEILIDRLTRESQRLTTFQKALDQILASFKFLL